MNEWINQSIDSIAVQLIVWHQRIEQEKELKKRKGHNHRWTWVPVNDLAFYLKKLTSRRTNHKKE